MLNALLDEFSQMFLFGAESAGDERGSGGKSQRKFDSDLHVKSVQEVLAQIKGDYERAYYQGIIWERFGNARIRHGGTGAGASAYHALREAMDHYERAMNFAIPGNDDAILRWNTCARVIMQNPDVRPVPESEAAEAWERDEAGSRIADA